MTTVNQRACIIQRGLCDEYYIRFVDDLGNDVGSFNYMTEDLMAEAVSKWMHPATLTPQQQEPS